jgi:hypothetical protein
MTTTGTGTSTLRQFTLDEQRVTGPDMTSGGLLFEVKPGHATLKPARGITSFVNSTAVRAVLLSGAVLGLPIDPVRRFVLATRARSAYLSAEASEYPSDLSTWTIREVELVAAGEAIFESRGWVDLALELFAGSRNMTRDEWTRFSTIVNRSNRPLGTQPKGLPRKKP